MLNCFTVFAEKPIIGCLMAGSVVVTYPICGNKCVHLVLEIVCSFLIFFFVDNILRFVQMHNMTYKNKPTLRNLQHDKLPRSPI